ncbi:MAG: MFS transporter [Candidatus Binatia bacterium]
MARLQQRWVVLAGCFLVWFMVGGVQTFTLFIAPWSREFGWTITAISLAASVQLAVNGLFSPFGGKLADRFGTKRVLMAYILALGAGALAVGHMTSFWEHPLSAGISRRGVAISRLRRPSEGRHSPARQHCCG